MFHLNKAMDAHRMLMWRERYANPPQWESEQILYREMAQKHWSAAKSLIGEHRLALEKLILSDSLDKTKHDTFLAALETIDKELELTIERDLIEEDDMNRGTKWEDDEYLVDEEVLDEEDEDAIYVRETEQDYNDEAQTEDDDAFIDNMDEFTGELEEEF